MSERKFEHPKPRCPHGFLAAVSVVCETHYPRAPTSCALCLKAGWEGVPFTLGAVDGSDVVPAATKEFAPPREDCTRRHGCTIGIYGGEPHVGPCVVFKGKSK